MGAGTAVHIAGILEDGIILNSQEPYAKVRRMIDVSDYFQRSGHDVVIRGIDREALARLASEKKNRCDLDKELSGYFDFGEK
jgi:murein DD-endopeptidase